MAEKERSLEEGTGGDEERTGKVEQATGGVQETAE